MSVGACWVACLHGTYPEQKAPPRGLDYNPQGQPTTASFLQSASASQRFNNLNRQNNLGVIFKLIKVFKGPFSLIP